MLEEFMNVMTDDNLSNADNEELKSEVADMVDGLELFSGDSRMLTNTYTNILSDDNIVYLMTRISQHPIFSEHFPEFYAQNENGESVINCQQNSPYHRYGVFRHILYTVEYVGKDNLKYSKQDLKILKWTMFLHDIGKPFVKTTNAEGRDSFAGHDDVSVEMAKEILPRFNFTQEETKIILTLIKYHDRYLNEGELTRDNLVFLAQELENRKELFEYLIEVKIADNKAKSVDVYNKFLTVLPKYEEFANEYFKDIDPPQVDTAISEFDGDELFDDEIIGKTDEIVVEKKEITKKKIVKDKNKRLTTEEFNEIYDCIINDQNLTYLYQPIIDATDKKVFAYDVSVTVQSGESLEKIFLAAKEEGRYDKIKQLLLTNSVTNGIKSNKDNSIAIVIRTDLNSYIKYNNKNRIYDAMDKNNIIISFENYDDSNAVEINNLCKEIRKKHGMVSLCDFNKSKFNLKDLGNMEVDFVEYLIEDDINYDNLKELAIVCTKDAKKVIAKNVKDVNQMLQLSNNGVDLFQGDQLFKANDHMEITDYEVESFIKKI